MRRSFSRAPFSSKWLFLLPDNHLIGRLNEIADYIRKVFSLPPISAAPEVTALSALHLSALYAFALKPDLKCVAYAGHSRLIC